MSKIVVIRDFEKEGKRPIEYKAYLTPAMSRLSKMAFYVKNDRNVFITLDCPVENVCWSEDMYYVPVKPI